MSIVMVFSEIFLDFLRKFLTYLFLLFITAVFLFIQYALYKNK